MGMTAIPSGAAPATPITSCPPDSFMIMDGSESISKAHPSEAVPTGGDDGTISVVDANGALRT